MLEKVQQENWNEGSMKYKGRWEMFLYINVLWKYFSAGQYPPVKSSDTERNSKRCNARTTGAVTAHCQAKHKSLAPPVTTGGEGRAKLQNSQESRGMSGLHKQFRGRSSTVISQHRSVKLIVVSKPRPWAFMPPAMILTCCCFAD